MTRSHLLLVVGLAVALCLQAPPVRAQELLWENRGQADFGGGVLDVKSEGNVVVACGIVVDEADNTTWFVRAHDRESGATLWEDRLPMVVFDWANQLAVDGGRVFAAGWLFRFDVGFIFTVRAYDLKSGTLLWERRENRLQRGDTATAKTVVAHGGRVFVAGYLRQAGRRSDFAVLAFDAGTGAPLWEGVVDPSGLGQNDAAWSLAVSGDRVFAAGEVRNHASVLLRAYDAKTGAVLWQTEVPGARTFAEEHSLAVHGDLVFLGGSIGYFDFMVRAYDVRSGALRWAHQVDDGDRFSTAQELTVAGGRLFAAGLVDSDPVSFVEAKLAVRAYDPQTGALLWENIYRSPGNDWFTGGLMSTGGQVFVGGLQLNAAGRYEATVRSYDAKTGSLQWEDRFDGGGDALDQVNALWVEGNRLFIGGAMSRSGSGDFIVRAYRTRP